MPTTAILAAAAAAIASLALAAPLTAQDGKLDLGLRTDLGVGNGEPTNDIIGYGLFGHYRLTERWTLGFAVDHSPEFDFERTPAALGLTTSEVFDAKGTSTTVAAWAERVHRFGQGRAEGFWNAGLGVNSVSMDDLTRPLANGGTFDIKTDAGTELLAIVGVGDRRWLGRSWGLEAGGTYDRHFADWTLTDRVSGATDKVADYSVSTLNVGLSRRF